MPKITRQEARDLLGVHPDTMRRWETIMKDRARTDMFVGIAGMM